MITRDQLEKFGMIVFKSENSSQQNISSLYQHSQSCFPKSGSEAERSGRPTAKHLTPPYSLGIYSGPRHQL